MSASVATFPPPHLRVRGEARAVSSGRCTRVAAYLLHGLLSIAGHKRGLSCQHVVEESAQGPPIHGFVVAFAVDNLRRPTAVAFTPGPVGRAQRRGTAKTTGPAGYAHVFAGAGKGEVLLRGVIVNRLFAQAEIRQNDMACGTATAQGPRVTKSNPALLWPVGHHQPVVSSIMFSGFRSLWWHSRHLRCAKGEREEGVGWGE